MGYSPWGLNELDTTERAHFTSLEHSLALSFFGIEMKADFSSPVATTEFSKCAGILSAALSQDHLLELEIAHWNSIISTSFIRSDAS